MNLKTLSQLNYKKTIIGKGYYGLIYLINIIGTNIKYVIKKVECSNVRMAKLLLNEIEVMTRLNNCQIENVSKILDYGVYNGDHNKYINILMEYIDGVELFDYIKNDLSLCNAIDQMNIIYRISISLLNIIHSMHINGIVHRDIRPENIMVKMENNIHDVSIVLIDFGLSEVISNKPINKIAGSINYLYPKLVIDYFYFRKSTDYDLMMNDIWGYCLTLFTMMYNKFLFVDMNRSKLINQYLGFLNMKYVDYVSTQIKKNKCSNVKYNNCLIRLFELIDQNIYDIDCIYDLVILMKIN